MNKVRHVLARLLEIYDLQRWAAGPRFETSHQVVAILMSDEDANAVREFLTGTNSYKEGA